MANRNQKAYLAGGCFWCLEAAFKLVPGVKTVVSGYAGGHTESPTYQQVSTGSTGHAEVVEVEFDPSKVSFLSLLDLFFKIHDPSQKDQQGADVGTQYRSAVFYTTDQQRKETEIKIKRLEPSYPKVYTEVERLDKFWPAEEYHQNYFEKHPDQAYCALVVKPKVEKAKEYLSGKKD